jgi:hypothetical protein
MATTYTTVLSWDDSGTRFYETGVEHCVLYPTGGTPVAWNGVISIEENPSGGEAEAYYLDGVKYFDQVGNEDYSAVISALSAPASFASCDGSVALAPGLFGTGQPRNTFGISYRTKLGNEISPELGYKLHIVYNATALPAGRSNKSLSGSAEPNTIQWTINAAAGLQDVTFLSMNFKPTAHVIIDSTKANPAALAQVEYLLYGIVGSAQPVLLNIKDVIDIMTN